MHNTYFCLLSDLGNCVNLPAQFVRLNEIKYSMSGEFWKAYFWLHHNRCLVLALVPKYVSVVHPRCASAFTCLKLLTCLFC